MSIDTSRPHISRIYDYVLGGTHNHEADRHAAEVMMDRMPSYPRWAWLNRWFLGEVGKRWASQGRTRVLDLGSGLPTQGHLNTHLPGASILFVDHDPETAAYGREILGASSGMEYAEIDIRKPEALLAKVGSFFGAERCLAVGFVGIMYFLSDDEVRRLMEGLHAFCAPGSTMALSFTSVLDRLTDDEAETIRMLEKASQTRFYHRVTEEVVELVKPWKMTSTKDLTGSSEPPTPAGRRRDPMHRFRVLGAFAEHE